MIAAIVCMSENRVIGLNNRMPWHLPADLQRVKKLTTGHIILMGRKTFESIGKPLPGRRNVILTTADEQSFPGCEVVRSVDEALQLENGEQTLFIFGGSTIYEQFLPYMDVIYMTVINEHIDGDTFFPELNDKEWRLVRSEPGHRDERNPYDFVYVTYERITFT